MSLTCVPDYRCLREGSEPGRVGPSRAERAEPNRAKRGPAFLWKANARASPRVLPRARGQRLRCYVRWLHLQMRRRLPSHAALLAARAHPVHMARVTRLQVARPALPQVREVFSRRIPARTDVRRPRAREILQDAPPLLLLTFFVDLLCVQPTLERPQNLPLHQ